MNHLLDKPYVNKVTLTEQNLSKIATSLGLTVQPRPPALTIVSPWLDSPDLRK